MLNNKYIANVISQNDYFPGGMYLPNRHESSDLYRFGYQGSEKDDEIKGEGNSINYKYRMHDPRVGRFFAVDPLAPQYPHNSPYAFSENVVIHAIEFEGLELFPIHGTWGTNEWGYDPVLTNEIANMFGNSTTIVKVDESLSKPKQPTKGWNGYNKTFARRKAAKEYAAFLKANHVAGEPITIIGHSHGGNVGILTMNILANDPDLKDVELNLITMNTPVREYQLNKNARNRVNHYQIFNVWDIVQASGGKTITIGEGEKLGKGEYGKAGRKFNSAVNIEYKPAKFGPNGWHQGWDPANYNNWLPKLKRAVDFDRNEYWDDRDNNTSQPIPDDIS